MTRLPRLLERGIPVLLYGGEEDLICNVLGIRRIVDNLEWGGQRGVDHVPAAEWRINDTPVGTWLSARNLTFVTIANASHMAPYDAPVATHDMMLRFLDVDLGLPDGAKAEVSSRVGSDPERMVVPTMSTGSWMPPVELPVAPPATAQNTSIPTSAPVQAESHDYLGNLFVLGLIGLAVATCLWVRRRSRRSATGGYHAVGQYVVGGAGRVHSPTAELELDAMEAQPFEIGEADEPGEAGAPAKRADVEPVATDGSRDAHSGGGTPSQS